MVIRIPDFLFAESTGHGPAPGELDRETRAAVAWAREAETEMAALSRSLGLAGEALKGGDTGGQRLAAARTALGSRAESGAFRLLFDRAAVAQARQESQASHGTAMQSLIGTIKAVAGLPIPAAEKAELGRALLRVGLESGVVAEPDLGFFEEAALSQLQLVEARGSLAAASAPGEALAILASARQAMALLPMDLALLEREAAERDAAATASQRGKLTRKEQDDLAAFARGELPDPLGEESFRLVHGARGALGAQVRYQAARREGEALALIRGKDDEAVDAARAGWQGDAAVFEAAVAKDAAERRRDPAGYALATVPGTSAALQDAPEAERLALLWSAQAAAGIPEDQRSLWTIAGEKVLAAAWDALPKGSAGRNEKLGYFEKHLASLPPALRNSAIGRMVRQGVVDGTEEQVRGIAASLDAGRFNGARQLVSGLQVAEPRPQRAQAQQAPLEGREPLPSDVEAVPTDPPPPPLKPARSVEPMPPPEKLAKEVSLPKSEPTNTPDLIDVTRYDIHGTPKPSIGAQMGMVQRAYTGAWKWNGQEDGNAAGHNHLVLVDPATGRPIDRKTGKPVEEDKEGTPYVAHVDDIDKQFLDGVARRTAKLLPSTTRWNRRGGNRAMQAENLAPATTELGMDVFVGAVGRTLKWEKGSNTRGAAKADPGGPTFMGIAVGAKSGGAGGYAPWLELHEGYDPNAVGFPSLPEGYWELSEEERYEQAPVFKLDVDQIAYIYATEYFVDSSISRLLEIPEVGAPENRKLIENVFDYVVNAGRLDGVGSLQRAIYDLLEAHDPNWLASRRDGKGYTRSGFADGDIGGDTIEGLRHLLELSGDGGSGLYEGNILKELNRRVHEERREQAQEKNSEDAGLLKRIDSFQWD